MALWLTVLTVLAVLIKANEATGAVTPKGKFLVPTVDCNSQGFKPNFTYTTENEEHHIAIDIDIGGFNRTECVSSMTRTAVNTTQTFLHGDFHSSYIDYIPYLNATNDGVRCDGVFEHWYDAGHNKDMIRYQVNVNATVTRTYRGKIERKTRYPFIITCLLEREVNAISTNNSFQVVKELVNAATVEEVEDTFTFDASIKFYKTRNYAEERTESVISPTNKDELFLQVEQAENQNLFKFVVKRCYATRGSAVNPQDPLDRDTFFDNECHVDETVGFNMVNGAFQFRILSFSFPAPAHTIFFHCDLYVCLADNNTTDCTQTPQSQCSGPTRSRRRRSVEGIDYDYQKTITAAQPVLLDGAQVNPPSCGEGFLFDRELEMCSRDNILEVRNIRLSQDMWRQEYANTSSLAFKELAKTKEYQLWVLLKTTRHNEIIHGVKVLRARSGSVIIDVAIKYSGSVTADEAFAMFKKVLYTPSSTTRVQNILQISHEKTIEYVPVMRSEKADTEKLILIVVVVVLFVVVFIAGVTLFKVRQVRQTSTTHAASGFDNKGIDA